MQDFRKLIVWQRSFNLAVNVYRATERFPHTEDRGLTPQTRRSSISVPSNIAEGCGRGSDADFARCLLIAMGSACELECQMLLAKQLGMLNAEDFGTLDSQVLEVKRLLSSLIRTVRPQKRGTMKRLRVGS